MDKVGTALALWLNASIAAQKAAESSASFFEGIRFIFIVERGL
jgi:hypothetical protein